MPIATAMVIAEFHCKNNQEYLVNYESKNNRVPENALIEFLIKMRLWEMGN